MHMCKLIVALKFPPHNVKVFLPQLEADTVAEEGIKVEEQSSISLPRSLFGYESSTLIFTVFNSRSLLLHLRMQRLSCYHPPSLPLHLLLQYFYHCHLIKK